MAEGAIGGEDDAVVTRVTKAGVTSIQEPLFAFASSHWHWRTSQKFAYFQGGRGKFQSQPNQIKPGFSNDVTKEGW